MRPDFLIVGAAKSATTWLARELGRHPQIYLPAKEIHYFSRCPERPWSWYESHFAAAAGAKTLGEHSNTYLNARAAPERIVTALPEVRLLAVLRHPVDRAYSGYCMQFEAGAVTDRIDEYLDPHRGSSSFLDQGLYTRHLERYLEVFERSRLKIMLFDDLQADAKAFLAEAVRFLGVDPAPMPAPGSPRNVRRYGRYFAQIEPVARWLAPRFPKFPERLLAHPFGRWTRSRLRSVQVEYPRLTPRLRERMCSFFADDVEQLESLIDRNLEPWRS